MVLSQSKNETTLLVKDSLLCYDLNKKIEEENNHLLWIKDNNQLKTIASKNLKSNNYTFQKTFYKYYSIALLNEGAFYNYTDQYQKAINCYKKSFLVAKKIKFDEQCASNLQNIGTAFDYLGKVDSSLIYFKKALRYANQSKNKTTIAYVLTDIGYVYNLKGNTTQAIENNLKALKIFEEVNDIEGIERTYLALGRVFDNQKEYQKAIVYYQKGFKIATDNQLENRQSILLNSLANSNFQLNKYSEAKKFARKSLTISNKNNFETAKAMSLKHLGEIALEETNFNQAENYLKQSAALFNKLNVKNNLARVQINLGKIYLLKKNYKQALIEAEKGFKIAKISNYPAEKKDAAELLSTIHQHFTNYKAAFDYQTLAKNIGDSIFYDENKNIALKSEFKYETEKKESQIKALSQQKKIAELENQRQKSINLFIIIFLVSLVVISFLLFKRYKTNKENELLKISLEETEKTLLAEKKATESELKALKSQMNPHFIFNALNSIQEQFMYGDKVIANEQMGNFTYLTRQILAVSGKKKIPLSTEVDILTKYLELEKMRFETDFTYIIQIDNSIDDEYTELPPMLIQPFVENSIKHGLLHKKGEKNVKINFNFDQKEEFLICTIEDNGIGRKKSQGIKSNKSHNSFSTNSVAQRLQLINERKTGEVLMYIDLEDEKGNAIGTRVILKIYL
ncbi:tetratricopeptide repeat-containing sensor histidine kinase [Flavobacterium dankookense]|nr:tetratricopeptide repeat protein [Flavobacterium dankookense]